VCKRRPLWVEGKETMFPKQERDFTYLFKEYTMQYQLFPILLIKTTSHQMSFQENYSWGSCIFCRGYSPLAENVLFYIFH